MSDGVEETPEKVVARVSSLAVRLSLPPRWLVAGVGGTSGDAGRCQFDDSKYLIEE